MEIQTDSDGPQVSPGAKIRWWPGILVAILTAGALIRVHLGEALDHQDQVLSSLFILVAGALGVLFWLLLLSRLPGRIRVKILICGLVLAVGTAGLFRIKGVSGNLMPILEFRWAGGDEYKEVRGRATAETSLNDFPQFLGQSRNGVVEGIQLAREWQAVSPKELWRQEVGDAWSGFAVVGEAAVTLEQKDDIEVISRYDLSTGRLVWTQGVPSKFETVIGGRGPRSTPTIYRGQVLAFGAEGDLRSVDLVSGELLWHRRLQDDYAVSPPEWGFASSPLIVELAEQDLVVVSIGGEDGKSLVAHDAKTGEPVWAAGNDRVGYSSPSLHTIADVDQILIFNGTSVASHSPTDGKTLWSFDWPGDHPHVAQPHLLGGDRVLVSSGYGNGSKLLQVTKTTNKETTNKETTESETDSWMVTELWSSLHLKAKFANFVGFEGKIYGLDDGILVCLDPETGKRCWKRGRYGHGQILLVGDLLLVQTEKGELKLIEPNPEEHRELGSIQALGGKSWNLLTLSGNRLLMRNADEAVCYELPLAG